MEAFNAETTAISSDDLPIEGRSLSSEEILLLMGVDRSQEEPLGPIRKSASTHSASARLILVERL